LTLYEDAGGLKEVKACDSRYPDEEPNVVYLTVRRYGRHQLAQRHLHFDKVEKGIAERRAQASKDEVIAS
jgi:hypothetical protein